MDTKLFARIGAGVFVAVVLTVTALELREGSEVTPVETSTVWVPDGDPLPAQLRACSAMGELAVSSPDCRAAWAEKRRRFLGIEADSSPAGRASLPENSVVPLASDAAPLSPSAAEVQ